MKKLDVILICLLSLPRALLQVAVELLHNHHSHDIIGSGTATSKNNWYAQDIASSNGRVRLFIEVVGYESNSSVILPNFGYLFYSG